MDLSSAHDNHAMSITSVRGSARRGWAHGRRSVGDQRRLHKNRSVMHSMPISKRVRSTGWQYAAHLNHHGEAASNDTIALRSKTKHAMSAVTSSKQRGGKVRVQQAYVTAAKARLHARDALVRHPLHQADVEADLVPLDDLPRSRMLIRKPEHPSKMAVSSLSCMCNRGELDRFAACSAAVAHLRLDGWLFTTFRSM